MIGFVSRFVGFWFVAGALVALVIDATKSIAASALTVTPLGQSLFSLAPSTLLAMQEFVQQRIEPAIGRWLWDPVIQWILLLPTVAGARHSRLPADLPRSPAARQNRLRLIA